MLFKEDVEEFLKNLSRSSKKNCLKFNKNYSWNSKRTSQGIRSEWNSEQVVLEIWR